MTFQLGIASWGELAPDPATGARPRPQERFGQMTALARTAEASGLHVVAVGEGHGPHHINANPLQLLSALAPLTSTVTLSAAAAVLPLSDPLRVAEEIIALDAVSAGRAELVAGQGGTARHQELFGVDPVEQEQIFEERLEQLLELLSPGPTDLAGFYRPEVSDVALPDTGRELRTAVWAASSGSPRSVLRAAGHGIGVMLNVMEGAWSQLVPYVKAYREALHGFGDESEGAVGLLVPGLVVPDDAAGALADPVAAALPVFAAGTRVFGAATAEDPSWTEDELREQCGPEGALLVGRVSDVAEKITALRETLGLDRVLVRPDVNGLPHEWAVQTVELLGQEVLPALG